MPLTPFLAADPAIQIHALAAILAVGLGPWVIYRPRRDARHRALGYTWVIAMALTAAASLAIEAEVGPTLGRFGLIHLLSLAVFYWLWEGVAHIRAGRRQAHAQTMRDTYWYSLGIAGAFTFLPGRMLNQMLFPEAQWLGYILIAAILALVGRYMFRNRDRGRRIEFG